SAPAALFSLSRLRRGDALVRALRNRALSFLGRISYSLYRWHVPVLAAAGATAYDHRFWRSTAAILVALGVATAAFFFVEQPLRRRWRHPRPAPEERAPETKHILVS